MLSAAALIPRGQTRPYAWVAERAGRPKAVRAVGSALGRNPVPLLIPCHRVTRSDGSLGDYVFGADAQSGCCAPRRWTSTGPPTWRGAGCGWSARTRPGSCATRRAGTRAGSPRSPARLPRPGRGAPAYYRPCALPPRLTAPGAAGVAIGAGRNGAVHLRGRFWWPSRIEDRRRGRSPCASSSPAPPATSGPARCVRSPGTRPSPPSPGWRAANRGPARCGRPTRPARGRSSGRRPTSPTATWCRCRAARTSWCIWRGCSSRRTGPR